MLKRKHFSKEDSQLQSCSYPNQKKIQQKIEYEDLQSRSERSKTISLYNLKNEYNEDDYYCQSSTDSSNVYYDKLRVNFQRQSSNSTMFEKLDAECSEQQPNNTCESNEAQNSNQVQCSGQAILPQFKIEFANTVYDYVLKNHFSPQTQFYLFADQVIDINYLRSVAQNQQEQFLQEEQSVCIFRNMKHINTIIHRIDNKYVEVKNELVDRYLETIDPIISMINSLGDSALHGFAQNVQKFWDGLQQYRNSIKQQADTNIFQNHATNREMASDLNFNKRVQGLDQNKLVYYCYYKVDYERQQFDSCQVGYSPALQELLAGNSYAFKEYISKNGFVDPLSKQYRFTKCFSNAEIFLKEKSQKNQKFENYLPDAYSNLFTLDQFQFPVLQKIVRYNLDQEYDLENGLNFNIHNILAIYEFILLDETIPEQLITTRLDTKYRQIVNLQEKNLKLVQKQVEQNKFIQTYYKNEVSDLLTKGNKWFKRCGVVDIPSKKRKECEEKIEEISFSE